jgi:hypothetical protein
VVKAVRVATPTHFFPIFFRTRRRPTNVTQNETSVMSENAEHVRTSNHLIVN